MHEYGLEVLGSRWETLPKVIENKCVKILSDFQIQTDKLVMANQPDTVVVDKHQRTAVVVDVAILRDGNIRKKEHEKLKKYEGLKAELEKMWSVKAAVVTRVIGALGPPTWIGGSSSYQKQHLSRREQYWEQLICYTEPSGSQASGRKPELEGDNAK